MRELTRTRDHFLVMCVERPSEGRTIYVITNIFTPRRNLSNVKSVEKDFVSLAPWQCTRFYTVRRTVISVPFAS